MAAGLNDKFRKAGASTVTTLAAPGKALADTSINVGSTTNYPTDTGIIVAIRQVDTAGELVAGTYTTWNAIVTSSTSLSISATPRTGSDQVYPAASTTQVYMVVSSAGQNDMVDGILEEHAQDGTHTDITATSLSTDTITEKTGAAGVTIDGLLIKDSKLATADSVVTANYTDGSVKPEHLVASSGTDWPSSTWTPTAVGWSSTSVAQYRWSQVGKIVTAFVEVTGTSNSTSTTLTLPVTARTTLAHYEGLYGLATDNGGSPSTAPRWTIDTGSNPNLVQFFTSTGGSGWTASGAKTIRATLIYEAA